MSTALAVKDPTASAIEQVLVGGDLSRLTPEQRVSYYNRICESLGLNPLTKPLAYITLNGKLTLYALKDCTEQLRSNQHVSVQIVAREVVEDCYIVTARATLPGGRQDESIGAVSIANLKGENRANAMMKAETKAKRRVTLSICGLGMLDETEVETIQDRGGYTVEAPVTQTAAPVAHNSSTPANASEARDPSVPNGGDSEQLTIVRVETVPTRNPNVTKHIVVLSDGREVSTIKQQLGALAEQLAQEGCAVTVETKTTRWGDDLVELHRVDADPLVEADPAEMLDDSQIPF